MGVENCFPYFLWTDETTCYDTAVARYSSSSGTMPLSKLVYTLWYLICMEMSSVYGASPLPNSLIPLRFWMIVTLPSDLLRRPEGILLISLTSYLSLDQDLVSSENPPAQTYLPMRRRTVHFHMKPPTLISWSSASFSSTYMTRLSVTSVSSNIWRKLTLLTRTLSVRSAESWIPELQPLPWPW